MDVVLQTNTRNPSLRLKEIRWLGESTGYSCLYCVESGSFSAAMPFYFEAHPLTRFLSAVEAMDRSLSGEATLKSMWEPDYVRLALDKTGKVRVSGELKEGMQLLRFEFETDQTCLRPLASALRECQELQNGDRGIVAT